MKYLHLFFIGVVLLLVSNFGLAQASYSPDPVLRNVLRKEVWQRLKPQTPKNQRLLMGVIFGSNQMFIDYEKLAGQNGFAPYEMATAASFYRIIHEEVSSGKEYSKEQIRAIHDEITKMYAKEKIDVEKDNKARQRKYDELILRSYWIAGMFELAKKNNPQIQQIAKNQLKANPLSDSEATLVQGSPAPQKSPQGASKSSNPAAKGGPGKNTAITPLGTNAMEDVEDVILRTVTSYGLSGVYVQNEVSVLFKNGDIFTNPTGPLESLDRTRSKRHHPKKWDKWKKQGNILYVTRSGNGKTYDWKKWFRVRPATKGMRINGRFKTLDPFGGSQVINATTVSFQADGRFAWKTIKGGDTAWKPIYSKSSEAGTYNLNNYTITLHYNSGKSESFFFGFYPKDKEHFIVGSSHFVPVED